MGTSCRLGGRGRRHGQPCQPEAKKTGGCRGHSQQSTGPAGKQTGCSPCECQRRGHSSSLEKTGEEGQRAAQRKPAKLTQHGGAEPDTCPSLLDPRCQAPPSHSVGLHTCLPAPPGSPPASVLYSLWRV